MEIDLRRPLRSDRKLIQRMMQAFRDELAIYEQGKALVQCPLDRPVPCDLIARIVKFRMPENLARAATKGQREEQAL